ncbi:MAG: hypothetical protein IKS31_08995 [Clostridia bacterium]|nr:hypothetical protein [Clostridia bacterium]
MVIFWALNIFMLKRSKATLSIRGALISWFIGLGFDAIIVYEAVARTASQPPSPVVAAIFVGVDVLLLIWILIRVSQLRKEKVVAAKEQAQRNKKNAEALEQAKKEEAEALEKTRKEVKDKVLGWQAKLREYLDEHNFQQSAQYLFEDGDVRKSVPGRAPGHSELVIEPVWSKGLLMDNRNRQMCFAWLTDRRGLGNYISCSGYNKMLIRYDDVIACEIICDMDRTVYADSTSSVERNTLYVNTTVSTDDKIKHLAVKLNLRNTSSPSFTFELKDPQRIYADKDKYMAYANQVCDAVNAAICL